MRMGLFFSRKEGGGVIAEQRARETAAAPRAARLTVLIAASLLGGALIWAGAAEVGEIARAEGEIAPTGELIRIDHLDGGVLRESLVRPGDAVEAGVVLARLDQPRLFAEREEALRRLRALDAEAARLRVLVVGEPVAAAPAEAAGPGTPIGDYAAAQATLHLARQDVLGDRIEARRAGLGAARRLRDNAAARVALNESNEARMMSLAAKGLVSEVQMTRQRDLTESVRAEMIEAEAALADAETALAEAEAARRELDLAWREEHLKALHEVAEESQRIALALEEIEGRIGRLELRAPEAGVIQTAAAMAPGEVTPPGGTLFELLPTGQRLVAIIRISPDDIGHIAPGQKVKLKPTTYDARRFGDLAGRIETISPTSFAPEQEEPYFRTVVALDDPHVGAGADRRPIRAGMVVAAEIETTRRTVLAWLLKPIQRSLDMAMTER